MEIINNNINSWCEDTHRDRHIHTCNECHAQILSYRDCTKEHHSLKCKGQLIKTDFLPLIPIVFSETGRKSLSFSGGVTEYHTGLGMKVNSRDIDKICKERGLVYGGEDISRECKKNREYNLAKQRHEFRKGLAEKLDKVL